MKRRGFLGFLASVPAAAVVSWKELATAVTPPEVTPPPIDIHEDEVHPNIKENYLSTEDLKLFIEGHEFDLIQVDVNYHVDYYDTGMGPFGMPKRPPSISTKFHATKEIDTLYEYITETNPINFRLLANGLEYSFKGYVTDYAMYSVDTVDTVDMEIFCVGELTRTAL